MKHDRTDIFLLVLVAAYNFALLAFSTLWIFSNAFSGVKKLLTNIEVFQINEQVTYGLFLSGVLGGTFYCLRGLYQRLGEAYTPIDDKPVMPAKTFNIKVWFFWYLFRPIQGGVLALVLLSFINTGLIASKQLSTENIKSFYGLVAVGFICGFGSHEVIHKIQELIQVLFAKSKVTGSNSAQKVDNNAGKR